MIVVLLAVPSVAVVLVALRSVARAWRTMTDDVYAIQMAEMNNERDQGKATYRTFIR